MTASPIHLIYAGGTFGSHGVPLMPLAADVFLPILSERLADAGYPIEVLTNAVVKDSSTLNPADFLAIYEIIIHAYADGVRQIVLISGTDTLSFLAAFLGYALADFSDLSVVITGSMSPLLIANSADFRMDQHSDAWANLTEALAACHDGKAGVAVQFAGRLMDARYTQKLDSQAHDAFIGAPAIRLPSRAPSFDITARLRALASLTKRAALTHIAAIYCLPNDSSYIAHQLSHLHPDTAALLLIGFGAGNLPTSAAIIDAISTLQAKGIVVISTTMCPFGGTNSSYAAGSWQYAHGIWSAGTLSIPAIYGQALWLGLNDILTAENWQLPTH